MVAEACSGLRYLFPLMSLGAIIGYMLHAPAWLRVTVFVVTIPITIVLNSIRIGLTGLLSEHWGLAHTRGFLHFFEGWVVFIVATLMLLVVLWALLRIAMPGKTIRDVLVFESPKGSSVQTYSSRPSFSGARLGLLWALVIVMVVTAILTTMLAVRTEKTPDRNSLDHFPIAVGEWLANEYRLPQETEGVAGASEYYIGDFTSKDAGSVNLYVSFYQTQLHGQIPHSPKVCIPGGGWQIENMRKIVLRDRRGQPFEANRLVIAKGGHRQLTYYWLKQGGRMYSQEWRARLDLIRISLFENRTDGALVRVVTEIAPQGAEIEADQRLQKFSGALIDVLSGYIPD
jgi:exosortase D (VPLPA-CTERM-specific)